MLRKWNRFLAILLALALVTTTFNSDFASVRVYADGEEIEESVEEQEESSGEDNSEDEGSEEDNSEEEEPTGANNVREKLSYVSGTS